VNETAIVGIGATRMERRPDRSLGALALDAALAAIEDAGLTPADIDGYAGTPPGVNLTAHHWDGIDEVSGSYVVSGLNLKNVRWIIDSMKGLTCDALDEAVHALTAGAASCVLIVRAMYNPPNVRYAEQALVEAGGLAQFQAPYGANSGIMRAAFELQSYMHANNATKADLFHIAKTFRDHALLNPNAYWYGRQPLTEDEYLSARMIFDPMCLFDCDIPVTGAGAVVITTAERARHLRQPPAYVRAIATAAEGYKEIYRKSKLGPKDVQVAQLYDGFLPFVWEWLELMEFCPPGGAHAFARDGNITFGGTLPVTTFGGSLCEGRFVTMGSKRVPGAAIVLSAG
jgi:acetyl-CoA acetyltransferase